MSKRRRRGDPGGQGQRDSLYIIVYMIAHKCDRNEKKGLVHASWPFHMVAKCLFLIVHT